MGDGGLQKWSLINGTWQLDYTLSSGLGLINATTTTADTTSLIGLTGKTNGDGSVSEYATNLMYGDTGQIYPYSISDTLANTWAPTNESFVKLLRAASDTNIRGVAFAPSAPTVCFASGTLIDGSSRCGGGAARGGRLDRDRIGRAQARALGWRSHPRPPSSPPARGGLARARRAHAFGRDRPARDLVVSPRHSLCLNVLGKVLIPASALVSGSTVQQLDVGEVTYWSVELDSHDILFAENMPEGDLKVGNRVFFAGKGEGVVALDASPDADPAKPAVRSHADFCQPLHAEGALVDAV